MGLSELLGNDTVELSSQVRKTSLGLVGTATFFWLWACKNTLGGSGFDLGVVSFALAAVANADGWRSTEDGVGTEAVQRRATRFRRLGPLSALVVSANYVVGLGFGSLGFRFYCFVFAGLWGFAAVWLNLLSARWLYDVSQGGLGGSGAGEPLKHDYERTPTHDTL